MRSRLTALCPCYGDRMPNFYRAVEGAERRQRISPAVPPPSLRAVGERLFRPTAMMHQLELFGPSGPPRPAEQERQTSEFDGPSVEWKSVFLAIFPDSTAAEWCFERGSRLCHVHGLRRRQR